MDLRVVLLAGGAESVVVERIVRLAPLVEHFGLGDALGGWRDECFDASVKALLALFAHERVWFVGVAIRVWKWDACGAYQAGERLVVV